MGRFEDTSVEIQELKLKDIELVEEDGRIYREHSELKSFTEVETRRIETQAEERRKSTEHQTNKKMEEGFEEASKSLMATKSELNAQVKTLREDTAAADAALDKWAREANDATIERFDTAVTELSERVEENRLRAQSEM